MIGCLVYLPTSCCVNSDRELGPGCTNLSVRLSGVRGGRERRKGRTPPLSPDARVRLY